MTLEIKKFQKYFFPRSLELVTGNAALAVLYGNKNHDSATHLKSWGVMLGAYQYTIWRHKSEEVSHVGYFSRNPNVNDTPVESEICYVHFTAENVVISTFKAVSCFKEGS